MGTVVVSKCKTNTTSGRQDFQAEGKRRQIPMDIKTTQTITEAARTFLAALKPEQSAKVIHVQVG
jgi:hypothetical protein